MAGLDLTPLRNATIQLEKYLAYADTHKKQNDIEGYDVARTACIQSFEYSYELAFKMIKRFLEMAEASKPDFDMTYKGMIRHAFEFGIIESPEKWFSYKDLRNITSHTYDEIKAEDAMTKIPAFLPEAKRLLSKLEQANVSG